MLKVANNYTINCRYPTIFFAYSGVTKSVKLVEIKLSFTGSSPENILFGTLIFQTIYNLVSGDGDRGIVSKT